LCLATKKTLLVMKKSVELDLDLENVRFWFFGRKLICQVKIDMSEVK